MRAKKSRPMRVRKVPFGIAAGPRVPRQLDAKCINVGGPQNRHRRKVPRPWLLTKSRGNCVDVGKKHRRGVNHTLLPIPFSPISTSQTSLLYARATKFAVVVIPGSDNCCSQIVAYVYVVNFGRMME